MKKNTIIGLVIAAVVAAIAWAISFVMKWNDIYSFWKDREAFFRIVNAIISFLEAHSVAVIVVVVILIVIIYLIWLHYTTEKIRRDTEKLSWFDANRRITDYAGGVGRLNELYRFFGMGGSGLSWWALAGVAGIGKTRLVIDALRSEELSNADVEWLKVPDDYIEVKLEELVKKTLKKVNLRNYIIAEDAQLYMDSIGKLIEHFANKTFSEIGDHEIRILLLIRMGEDENLENRYKQLVSKVDGTKINSYRYNHPKTEIKIEKYEENDIEKIIKSYIVNTKHFRKEKMLTDDQLKKIQETAIQVLKKEEVDSKHMRPLFAMFIADALLIGKDPMAWDRIRILEYATIEREEQFLKNESDHIQKTGDNHVFDKIRGIVCLSIIRNGMDYCELKGIEDELEKELALKHVYIKDFLKDLQLLGADSIISIDMPDILSEYYVLHTLVIKPDKEVLGWIIDRLCNSLAGADVIREKIRQNFNYLYDGLKGGLEKFYSAFFKKCSSKMAFDIITNLFVENDLHDSNTILLHEAIGNQIRNESNMTKLSAGLFYMIECAHKLEEKRCYLSELKRLVRDNEIKEIVIYRYCMGLVNMITYTPELKEKRDYLSQLEHFAQENENKEEIVLAFCKGLFNLLTDTPDLEEKKRYLSKLEGFAKDDVGKTEIVLLYCSGLVNMIKFIPELKEKWGYLSQLEQIAQENENKEEFVSVYGKGLVNWLIATPDLEEKKRCLTKLEGIVNDNNKYIEIVLAYCKGLANMIYYNPVLEEERGYLARLKRLAEANESEAEIIVQYCIGLVCIWNVDTEYSDDYIGEFYRLLSNNNFYQYFQEKKPDIMIITQRALEEYEQKTGKPRLGQ